MYVSIPITRIEDGKHEIAPIYIHPSVYVYN
jgi:hypothetical protein